MDTQMMEMMSMTMPGTDMKLMQECIESCAAAEQACTMCADSASGADGMAVMAGMCHNVCDMTNAMMRMLMRPQSQDVMSTMKMLEATMLMCRACATQCQVGAHMSEAAKMCAQVCNNCADACEALMKSMADGKMTLSY